MQPWPALKHPTPALPSRCPWALRIMVVPGEDVELGGQWRARHRWTANDLSFATVPLAASSVGFETLYEAIRKSRIVSAFPGGSPVTVHVYCVFGVFTLYLYPCHFLDTRILHAILQMLSPGWVLSCIVRSILYFVLNLLCND